MTITLELIGQICAILALVIGAFWALVKLLVRQFESKLDARFNALEGARIEGQKVWNERLKTMEDKTASLDKDVRQILIELPREYVNRTDYVRRETIIEGKIDQLALRMQNWILEARNGK